MSGTQYWVAADGTNYWVPAGTVANKDHMIVSASGLVVAPTATANGQYPANTWTIDGTTYTHNVRENMGNDFNTVILGNAAADDTVTLTMTVDNTGEGKIERGFMFGVTDTNGDGKIGENEDFYYLVDFTSENGKTNIGIERNRCNWCSWLVEKTLPDELNTDVLNLKVVYNNASFEIYVNDTLVISHTNLTPFTGTGYGVVSKTAGITLSNVTATVTNNNAPETTPDTTPETTPTPAPTGSPVIGLTVLAAVALAGVAVFSKKRYN